MAVSVLACSVGQAIITHRQHPPLQRYTAFLSKRTKLYLLILIEHYRPASLWWLYRYKCWWNMAVVKMFCGKNAIWNWPIYLIWPEGTQMLEHVWVDVAVSSLRCAPSSWLITVIRLNKVTSALWKNIYFPLFLLLRLHQRFPAPVWAWAERRHEVKHCWHCRVKMPYQRGQKAGGNSG